MIERVIWKHLVGLMILNVITSKSQEESVLNETKNEIEKLEIAKGKLYHRIMAGIEESMTLLNLTNDTEALVGINFMKELKEEIENINGTDLTIAGDIEEKDKEAARRKFNAADARKQNSKLKLSADEIMSLFNQNPIKGKKGKELNAQQLLMQKRIEEWMEQKRLESQKIRDYYEKMKKIQMDTKIEKCRRFGLGSKKKRFNGTRRKIRYPCCRKCCKKSYLGCL